MRKRNGIPIDIPSARKKAVKDKVLKHPEYNQYNVYVTMFKHEDGQNVWTIVPIAHPVFKELKKTGYRIIEKWDKREVSA
ncbi:hypothetical protein [Lysinibacillus sp. BSL11]